MKRIRQSAAARWIPGKASKYIRRFRVRRGDKVVLACRVSRRDQKRTRKLARQAKWMRHVVERRGGIVVATILHVGSGTDASWLAQAAAEARQHDAIILAYSTDRLRRNRFYHSVDDMDAQATDAELLDMLSWANGVPLMTYLDPDATPKQVRSHQSRRGHWASQNKGGRGKKKPKPARRSDKKPSLDAATRSLIIQWWSQGHSYGDIGRRVNRARSTVQSIIAKHKPDGFVHPAK